MELTLDLHSHSGYSGGVGQISLEDLVSSMQLKGLDVFGTGDVLHPLWSSHLKQSLSESQPGLFTLKGADPSRYFLLQTEVIVSYPFGSRRKSFHLLLFFPSFKAADALVALLQQWEVKNTIGRPFVTCLSLEQLAGRLYKIREIDPLIEIVPAHVMTPDGFFGSDNPVYSMSEAFGSYANEVRIIETGLSADPFILDMIPEFRNITYISNSDCHSADLKRIGREFTRIESAELSYKGIIDALRANRVLYTGEFSVFEGRYFLTGHRQGKKGHADCGICFYPGETPEHAICPQCGKPLTVGVLEQAVEIASKQGNKNLLNHKTDRKYVVMVPLLEVLAAGLKKGPAAKAVKKLYLDIVTQICPESTFWLKSPEVMQKELTGAGIPEEALKAILDVKNGNFSYEPIGYDGSYGSLALGKKSDIRSLLKGAVR